MVTDSRVFYAQANNNNMPKMHNTARGGRFWNIEIIFGGDI